MLIWTVVFKAPGQTGDSPGQVFPMAVTCQPAALGSELATATSVSVSQCQPVSYVDVARHSGHVLICWEPSGHFPQTA